MDWNEKRGEGRYGRHCMSNILNGQLHLERSYDAFRRLYLVPAPCKMCRGGGGFV